MSVKINSLEIENVKRIKAVKLEPSANGLTIIGGNNNQGKTSVLDAIAWALGGDKYKPTAAARDGAYTDPILHVELSNGLIVERKGKNSSLKVIDPNGNKAGQQLLNSFLSALALDLPKFMNASDKEKAAILLQIIGVGEQLAQIESEESRLYNQRTAIGRIADQKQKYASELQCWENVPNTPVSASELIARQQEILARNGENQRKRENAARYAQELTAAQAAYDAAKQRLELAEQNAMTAQMSAQDLQDESTAELEKSIAEIDAINMKIRDNLNKEHAEEEAKTYRQDYEALTEQIHALRQEKQDLLHSADLPLEGLTVENGTLQYHGKQWDSMSGSEQLRVAAAIVRKLNPDCGFVLLDKLERTSGLKCAVEKAEQTCLGEWYRVTVGSVQTLMRQKRLAQFPPDYFQTIIIDEAHHAISGSYQVILEHFAGAHVLGVTATPDRGDKQNLGKVFDSLAYEYTLPQAIHEGYLTPIRALTVPVQIDFTHVGTAAGDYKPGDIATALDPYLEQIAAEMAKHCADRKTVVFLPLVKTSQKFRDILCQHGFRAAEVNGESEDREQVLQDFADGKYNVLCNSMLLTEGWDCPEVDCVVVLRSTKVRALYCQMVGRGTRLAEGKDHLLLLDFLWNTEKHELCRPACLICEDEEVQQKMTQQLEQQPGVPVDIEEAENKASEDVVADRESKLAEQLESMKKRKSKLVDPLQYEMSIQSQDLTGYVPAFGWESNPPTAKQKKDLEKRGINPDAVESAGKAEQILRTVAQRQQSGLATPKQIRCLEKYGFAHVGGWSFDAAKNLINRIAANGWRVPRSITAAEYVPEV